MAGLGKGRPEFRFGSPLWYQGPNDSLRSMQKRRFTREELHQYNGKDGSPTLVAFNGKVYDVTDSFLWKEGRHQAMHDAGSDLTESMNRAPHGAEFLKQFPMVGTVREK